MKAILTVLCLVCAASLSLIFTWTRTSAQDGVSPSAPGAVALRRTSVPSRISELLSAAGVDVGEDVKAPDGARARSHRETRVNWEADKASPQSRAAAGQNADAPGRFILARTAEKRDGGLPKQRSAELSPNHVMVVAVDAGQRLRWWGLIEDPRIVRAEWEGPDGKLTGRTLYREGAEFIVHYPDDESITEVRLYHPDWDGKNFSLKLLGSVKPSR